LGKTGGRPFPAPGGLPDGIVGAGASSVRFAVTAPSGASALDIGRPPAGPGYRFLRLALTEVLAGETRHGGALLSTLGIRFIVAGPGDLPAAAVHRLGRQFDLDRLPAEGLTIFRDEIAAPLASTVEGEQWRAAAASTEPAVLEALPLPLATPLGERAGGAVWEGQVGPRSSFVYLAQQFDSRWRLNAQAGASVRPERAFGWGIGFPVQPGSGRFDATFGGQAARTFQVALLAALWLAALWVTRRPVRDG